MKRWAAVALTLLAVVLATAGTVLLVGIDDVSATSITVDGVPMLEVTAHTAPTGDGVVVAHGFAGSAALMRGIADTLARRGYLVVVPDLAGHGANATPLSDAEVDRDIDAAVAYLRRAHGIASDHVALVGHSMGAAAVTRYGATHAAIPVTVALSLPDASALPIGAAAPHNLLLLFGGLEFASFPAAALDALHRGYPDASLGVRLGDPGAGTARSAVAIPGVEHISILYAPEAHRRLADWIDESFGRAPGGPAPRPTQRLGPAGLLLAAFAIGFAPLVGWLLPRRGLRMGDPLRNRTVLAGALVGGGLAVAGARVLPTTALPLAVGGYCVGFFAIVGAVLIGVWGEKRVPRLNGGGRRMASVAPILGGYAVAAVAIPLNAGFTRALPVGERWWLLPIVVTSVFALLLGAELASGRRRSWIAVILAITVAALLLATVIRTAPGFILLVLPLLVILLAWHLAWSTLLDRRQAPAWLIALVGAILVGWPIATILPLTG